MGCEPAGGAMGTRWWHEDGEVGGLAIFSASSHSTSPPGCVGLGHGGATSPKSHEAGDLEASCGSGARGGWGWIPDQTFRPHLCARSPEGSIACRPICQASRGPREPVREAGARGHWCCSGCWEWHTPLPTEPPGPHRGAR